MCKHKLEQIPFCTCHNLNPNTHSSSKLLPSKEARFFFSGCANASLNIFPFARAKTPIQTHFRLHSCYPRTKTVPPRLQKQNCTNCVFCAVHVQCTHSARSSARPQNGLNTMGLAFFDNFQKHFFGCFLIIFGKILGIYTVLRLRTVACTVRALCKNTMFVPCPLIFSAAERCNSASGGVELHSTSCYHATRTASDLQFLPTCGANAAMLLLCLWVAAVKMKVCLDWGLGTCKREFVQACVCTSMNQVKQICCVFVWWVAPLKMRMRLDWGLGNPKVNLFKLGIRCDVTTCRSMAVFLKNPVSYDILWCPLISHDILWYLLISYEIFWYPMISFDILLCISFGIRWYFMISFDILWYPMISLDFLWYLMISFDILWYPMWYLLMFWYFANRTRIQNQQKCSHSDVSKTWVYNGFYRSSWRNCSLFSMLCRANSCQASSVHKNSCTAQSRRWTSRSTGRMGFTTRCAWRGQCVASCVALSALVSLMSHIHSRFKRVMTYDIYGSYGKSGWSVIASGFWLDMVVICFDCLSQCALPFLTLIALSVLCDSFRLRYSAPPKHSPTSHSSLLARSPAFQGAESEPPPAPEEEALDKDQVKPASAAYGRSLGQALGMPRTSMNITDHFQHQGQGTEAPFAFFWSRMPVNDWWCFMAWATAKACHWWMVLCRGGMS